MAEEVNVQSAIKKGQVIARFCHPSALQIIQQWIARLKKRWDEVTYFIILFYEPLEKQPRINDLGKIIKSFQHFPCICGRLEVEKKLFHLFTPGMFHECLYIYKNTEKILA